MLCLLILACDSDCRGTGPLKTTMDVIDAAKVWLPIRTTNLRKEWQTGARMGACSIVGSFGGTIERTKIFSLTQE